MPRVPPVQRGSAGFTSSEQLTLTEGLPSTVHRLAHSYLKLPHGAGNTVIFTLQRKPTLQVHLLDRSTCKWPSWDWNLSPRRR